MSQLSGITVLIGGARAGKTTFAERMAVADGRPVTYLATSPRIAGDDDLEARIARHRADRPAEWTTVEEELDVIGALRSIPDGVVLFDCVTTWVGNLLHHGHHEPSVIEHADAAITAACGRAGPTIVVTNEVGLGVVPPTQLGRVYRDLLGRVNQRWVGASDRALLLVAGRALTLQEPESFA